MEDNKKSENMSHKGILEKEKKKAGLGPSCSPASYFLSSRAAHSCVSVFTSANQGK